MNVLIIGSAGFIGGKLFEGLSQKYNFFGADIVAKEKLNNYCLLDKNIGFNELFESNNFDVCINASGAANVSNSFLKPDYDMQLNVMNVEIILECIRKHQQSCHFITLSSAAVYGNPVTIPIKETDCLNPISPYGLHKFFSEELCKFYTQIYGLKTTVLRIFSAYGEGLRKQLLWDMMNKFLLNENIVLHGTGNETRDFIHINDIIRCVDLIIQNNTSGFNIFNIANGEQTTVKYIAEYIRKYLNSNKDIHFTNENRLGDPLYWQADISNIKTLGYKKSISIEEGISSYVSWISKKIL